MPVMTMCKRMPCFKTQATVGRNLLSFQALAKMNGHRAVIEGRRVDHQAKSHNLLDRSLLFI